ncbi:MAG: cystathionine gamma-synthase [Elusimicrobia bacterium]|nr:cystathionine gamma-synthase [Elusimicrobiota bacterium]
MKRAAKETWRFATTAIHGGQQPDPSTGAIMPPVYLTSTYVQKSVSRHPLYDYARTIHPTRLALEKNLAAIEGGRYGLAFASGMAAISSVLLGLQSGDHVISGRDIYGGTYRVFQNVFQKFGVRFTFVDTTQAQALRKAVKPSTRLIWIETPSNPLLQITDIRAVCEVARRHKICVAVDNTFATPFLQRPLGLGADFAVHSTTKYLGGHSDVVGGGVALNDVRLYERLKYLQNAVGAIPGPLDSFLVLRGIKTLGARMRQHCANALEVAEYLSRHPKVSRVYYPGLPAHPGHAIASGQMSGGFGGIVSFELNAPVKATLKVLSQFKVFSLAESLGGVESLLCHPVSMTHASIPKSLRIKSGLTDGLIRLSVGIEDAEDLLEDLEGALAAV